MTICGGNFIHSTVRVIPSTEKLLLTEKRLESRTAEAVQQGRPLREREKLGQDT